MAPYQPFPITEFKSGINTYLQPWIRPADAFEPLVNAHVYRGVLTKRNGSTIFGNQLADTNPVMGLMQFRNESTGAVSLVAATTQNLYLYSSGATPDAGTFSLLTSIGGPNSVFWQGAIDGSGNPTPTATSILTFWQNLTPTTVTFTLYGSTTATGTVSSKGTASDSGGAGSWACTGNIASATMSGSAYTTGTVSFTFTSSALYNCYITITATTSGGYFSANITNFFNWVNWQPTSSITTISTSYLWMVNNNDPVTIFDGTHLARPILNVLSNNANYIETALDVKVYNNRLLLLRPDISSEDNPANQDIYYSAQFNPFNFVGDIAGNGGAISAATGDFIKNSRFIRDNLIVSFTNSTWSFQVTGLKDPPFIFRRLNGSKNISCPYAAVTYDDKITNLGNTGFIECDGYNVQRYDANIVDYYETQISQQYFNQDFALRYDNLNQTWMFYPSVGADPAAFPLVGSIAPGSDQTLVYNFMEKTWATYNNSFPMTCMGLFYVTSGTTWEDLTQSWESTDAPWFSYGTQSTAPMLLAGDTSGNVYHMDNPLAVRDGQTAEGGGTSFAVNITTTRWNPFIAVGQKTQFGYIDIYYSISSTDPTNPIQLTLSFFVDNSGDFALKQILTLDGPVESAYALKRIYVNLTGEFIQMNIDPSEDAQFEILGFILWARPAGRLTP